MTELAESSCEVCRVGAPLLTEEELASMKGEIPDWELVTLDGVQQLQRVFKFKNFVEALEFANLVGETAEKEGHHPAIVVEWGKVTVRWWTHKIGGLHQNDVIMAAKTDCLFPEYK